MLFVSKKFSLEKVAFVNSSCCVICYLNWIVFMAVVKYFQVKMRLVSFCHVNLIAYTTRPCVFVLSSAGEHVLTGNKCYTINIVFVIVDMFL